MIATLPMYDVPAGRAAQARFWARVQHHLPDAPDLSVSLDPWTAWHSTDLFLSQTCGLPYRAQLHDTVQLVCTADHGLDGCPPGYYRSAVVGRRDRTVDLGGSFTLAFNDALSQSGWAAPWAEGMVGVAHMPTGSHAASAAAVRDGHADAAALDAVTWSLLQRDWAGAADLHVLHWTQPTPALPFITTPGQDAASLFRGLKAALQDLSQDDRDTLHMHDFVKIPRETYLAQKIPPLPQR